MIASVYSKSRISISLSLPSPLSLPLSGFKKCLRRHHRRRRPAQWAVLLHLHLLEGYRIDPQKAKSRIE